MLNVKSLVLAAIALAGLPSITATAADRYADVTAKAHGQFGGYSPGYLTRTRSHSYRWGPSCAARPAPSRRWIIYPQPTQRTVP
jgi:hypothetical protein